MKRLKEKLTMHRTAIGIIVFLIMLTGAALAFGLKSQAQSRVWNIKIQQSGKEPLAIKALRLGDQQIQSGADFAAADDDLARLKVEVYNPSSQSLAYAELYLDLLTKEGAENEVHRIEIKYGGDYFTSPNLGQAAIGSRETVQIGWDSAGADLKALNEMHGGHHLPTTGDLELGAVVFSNKTTAWMMGRYLFLDGNGKWKIDSSKIEQKKPSGQAQIIGQCYDLPTSGDPVRQTACSVCSDCSFMQPVIFAGSAGYLRKIICRKCFHLVNGFIDQNSPCSLATGAACDETGVYTLDFSKSC